MAAAPISTPRLYTSQGTSSPGLQRSALPDDATAVFVAGQFVVNTSGELDKFASDGALVYGLALDASQTATAEPYNAPYGENHNPLDPRGQRFIMNITDASGTVGSGTTTQASITVGTNYSGIYLASPYTSVLGIRVSGGSNAIFKVVGKYDSNVAPDGDASGDFNGRVIVEIIPTAIQ